MTNPETLGQPETTLSLSLQEAIARALQHNLTIKVEAYNPGIREAQITEALAAFDPVFFGQSQLANQDQPVALGSSSNGVTWNNNLGLRKLLPSGGTAQFTVGDIYRDLQSDFVINPNPSHNGSLGLALTQPLLRGFGSSVTQANIYLAQRDRSISLAQFRNQTIKAIADVEEAYHNLVLSNAIVDAQERLLKDTDETYRIVRARERIDADRASIKQTEAAVYARRAELVRAKTVVRNQSDRLKSLINDPELELRSNLLLVPSDRPADVPVAYNLADEVSTALRQRPELQQARLQIERADIVIEVAKNDLLPKLDATFSTQSSTLDADIGTAMGATIDAAKYIDYALGIRFEIPIGNRQAEAALKRRKLERRQALTQMLNVAQQVILDVRLQLRDVMTSYEEIVERGTSRTAAGEELAAITARGELERLSPEYLNVRLQSQQRRANAEILEAQALVSYNIAIMRLEQAKGTLLEYNRIAIGPAPETQTDQGKIRLLGETYQLEPQPQPPK